VAPLKEKFQDDKKRDVAPVEMTKKREYKNPGLDAGVFIMCEFILYD